MNDINELYKVFTSNMRRKRKLLNITQAKLGKMIGASTMTISQLETGKVQITLKQALKIAYALDCDSLDELLGIKKKSVVVENLSDLGASKVEEYANDIFLKYKK